MLLVAVRVGPSPIHGLGAFTRAPIAAGAIVWRFTAGFDLDLEPAVIDSQPPHFRAALLRYGYIDARLRRFILCCDDARFINHSDTPNLGTRFDEDARYGVDFALRAIDAGEELTIDYGRLEGQRP
ncbi:MAG TPA: SET domain-containing protein [Burkholderiaceae bacterium]|nr:SET domain-containing protein [Burkholderiaceae bacterium]